MYHKNLNSLIKSRFSSKANPFNALRKTLNVRGTSYNYYSLPDLKDPKYHELPFSIRVLLESAVRNCDEFAIKSTDISRILNWSKTSTEDLEIPFKPARVVLQDFTGVPSIVNLASMRECIARLGKNPEKVNPIIPVGLVVDHSVMSDYSRVPDAVEKNEALEFERNYERFEFLKWGQQTFNNLLVVPPGSGIVHQVNLEYLAHVVFHNKEQNLLYPDSLVGADSHTTMINGLGVTGWGVGGIEAESVMLGEPISMVLPQVVGFYLDGELRSGVTATDLVLTATQMLRKKGVVGKFVEFFGPGVKNLSLGDRATMANMAPEYGATMGYFPVDENTLKYMRLTGRDEQKVLSTEAYLKAQNLFQTHDHKQQPKYLGEILSLNLSTVESCVSGPKRPHDRVPLKSLKEDWTKCLRSPVGFKGFGLTEEKTRASSGFTYQGKNYSLNNGSVIIAAITSCTNTSNPENMLAAGLLAKNAVAKGLKVNPYIKTTLSPGSGVVTKVFEASGLDVGLKKLGFETVGYGCMTCIGNTGELDTEVSEAIQKNDLVVAAVLSGNRNFEARIHPLSRANYLASPPLVVAFALAGRVDIDFEKEPLGHNEKGEPVYLKDIWPDRKELLEISEKYFQPSKFIEVYSKIAKGKARWNEMQVPQTKIYKWNPSSTYIHEAPFFKDFTLELKPITNIDNAYCLLNMGDSITTDHISPAGNISKNSPAGKYLMERGVQPKDFNSYGCRRGNDEIMARGTFANTRIINKMVSKVGPQTVHVPTGKVEDVFYVTEKYKQEGKQMIVVAGQEYGTGSSRDWAAKGPYLLGVRAVIAQSFERIHRSNLVGMGILPLQFKPEENADKLGLNGLEQYSIDLKGGNLKIGEKVLVRTSNGKTFETICRLDTEVEVEYFRNGGILQYVLRKLAK